MRGVVAATALGAVAASSVALAGHNQVITGPDAVYWLSASTTNEPKDGPISQSTGRSLSMGRWDKDASKGRTSNSEALSGSLSEDRPDNALDQYIGKRPTGRVLVFWGCSEHALRGQPLIVDLKYAKAPAVASILKRLRLGMPMPTAARHHKTERRQRHRHHHHQHHHNQVAQVVPAPVTAQLEPVPRSPEAAFGLTPDQEFMAPITLDAHTRLPSGAIELRWSAPTGVSAYFASAVGEGEEGALAIWTSSKAGPGDGRAPDYLSDSEIKSLVSEDWLLRTGTQACTLPVEAMRAFGRGGRASVIAYGGESNFIYPARPTNRKVPWHIKWETKVRYRSSGVAPLDQAAGR